jgi:hypothetical protein
MRYENLISTSSFCTIKHVFNTILYLLLHNIAAFLHAHVLVLHLSFPLALTEGILQNA